MSFKHLARLVAALFFAVALAQPAEAAPAKSGAKPAGRAAPRAPRATVELTGTVNINTATEDELRRLPGVGASKAKRIVAARAQRKFERPDQIMRVKGIGKKMFRKLKPHLSVSGPTTLEPKAKKAKGKPKKPAATAASASGATTTDDGTPEDAEPSAALGRPQVGTAG